MVWGMFCAPNYDEYEDSRHPCLCGEGRGRLPLPVRTPMIAGNSAKMTRREIIANTVLFVCYTAVFCLLLVAGTKQTAR